MPKTRLKLLPYRAYKGVNRADPIRFYYWPVLGGLYRRRIELCLDECSGGGKVLEVGFGTGLSFLNLNELYEEIHGLDLTADIAEVQSVFEPLGIQTHLRLGNVMAMPYGDQLFDCVVLSSILEHLKPEEQATAFREIHRVLKPGGQVVYGVPVERKLMVFLFRVMGVDIRQHHFSTHEQVRLAAQEIFGTGKVNNLTLGLGLGSVYQVGNFQKAPAG